MTASEQIIEQFQERINNAHTLIKTCAFTTAVMLAYAFFEMYIKMTKGGAAAFLGFCGIILTIFAIPLALISNLVFALGTGLYALLNCLCLPFQLLKVTLDEEFSSNTQTPAAEFIPLTNLDTPFKEPLKTVSMTGTALSAEQDVTLTDAETTRATRGPG